jgi:hypothetical protein
MELIDDYNLKFEQFCNSIPNNKYMFEISKLCGYGEFITIFKKQPLLDLYNTISLQFNREIIEIFFLNSITNEKIKIPITTNMTIQDFISTLNSEPELIIKPIYPVPCKVVYKIYYDDGHTHGNKACVLPNLIT